MHVSAINIYPIKSLKGIGVDSSVVEERGLRHDRRWLLTDGYGVFLTQRQFPRMALIEVGVGDDGLYVTADGFGTMELAFSPDTGNRQQITIWQSFCDGDVYSATVNEWFSDVLATGCQLVHMPDDSRRSVNSRFDSGNDVVSFADGYPLMTISDASLSDLNSRLDAPLPMNRFRPNLVVSGTDAYAEDDWASIRVGDALFRTTKPCERCVITTVDQSTGEFAGKEPLKTLASYRLAKMVMPERLAPLGINETAVLFGQNLISESPGTIITIGDEVTTVVELKSTPPPSESKPI